MKNHPLCFHEKSKMSASRTHDTVSFGLALSMKMSGQVTTNAAKFVQQSLQQSCVHLIVTNKKGLQSSPQSNSICSVHSSIDSTEK